METIKDLKEIVKALIAKELVDVKDIKELKAIKEFIEECKNGFIEGVEDLIKKKEAEIAKEAEVPFESTYIKLVKNLLVNRGFKCEHKSHSSSNHVTIFHFTHNTMNTITMECINWYAHPVIIWNIFDKSGNHVASLNGEFSCDKLLAVQKALLG